MPVYSDEIAISSKGECDMVDITKDVEAIVEKSRIKNGIVCLFVAGSTGAITTIEYEPGLRKDLPLALERIAARSDYYHHHETWNDGNGHSHVRASIIGPSLTIPVVNSRIVHGMWQQIVFIELDIRKRNRRIVVQIVGE
jgi:secondary thiamine-phosphate synthase enzyme